jgi:hypothetical protein
MSELETTVEKKDPEALKKEAEVKFWLAEIDAALKRERDYRSEGKRILDLYTAGKKNPFAMLYSNTETLLPALYSAVPRPVVQRRFKDDDQLGKLAAQAGQRVLEFLVDTNIDGYETFDEGVRSAVLSGLLPGRGVTSVKYDAEVVDVREGETATPVKNWETVCPDSKKWDRVLFGYANKWSKVPWVAYELHLEKDEAKKAGVPEAILDKIVFTKGIDTDEERGDSVTEKKQEEDEKNVGERETALFYQIWDKDGGRKVKYLCPQYKDDLCVVLDDPLGLTGFFDCPKPLMFVERVHDLTPVPVYALYEQQAEEVNELTRRISKLIKAIKARGAYDGELGDDLKKILESDEGDLVPTDKGSSLSAEKGLDNAIWMWPVEQLIVVLKELYVAREQAKRVIYEITGISDIIRGSTVASETATAQEIKSQWGTLRLKRLQKEVQRYARDVLRLMLDVAAHKFSEKTWAQMTGLPFITTEEFEAAKAIAEAYKAAGAQPDQQTQAKLQMPVWGKILELLRDDLQRAYRIDIESNSTVEPEATEDREMIAEVMNALAQYLNGVAPLVQSGSMPFEAAQAMLLAITRRFRFGPEIEDYVKAMKPPQPPDDGKKEAEMVKLQMEREKHGLEMQKAKADFDLDMQAKQADLSAKMQIEQMKLEVEREKLELEREKLRMQREHMLAQHQVKVAGLHAQVAAAHAMPKDKGKSKQEARQ